MDILATLTLLIELAKAADVVVDLGSAALDLLAR